MPEAIIETRELRKTYRVGDVDVNALDGVDVAVAKGELVSIVGPSGSGKTTLLNMIGCLDKPTSGEIRIAGRDVTGFSARELDNFRLRTIGFVFQRINLVPILSAQENVELPMEIAGVAAGERKERAAELLKSVGLSHRLRHRPAQMSAGEQQRVGIARAVANNPSLLLADEPTGNLDSKTSTGIVELLSGLHGASGLAIIVVTHNREVADRAARTITIRDGKIA